MILAELRLWPILIGSLGVLFSASCVEDTNDRQSASGSSRDAEYVAEEPIAVTGAYLRCSYLDSNPLAPILSVGCNRF